MHNHRDYAKNEYWTEHVSGGDQLKMLAIYGTDVKRMILERDVNNETAR